jgi:multiple sugar transport system permease protein
MREASLQGAFATSARQSSQSSLGRRQAMMGYVFIAPAIILFIIFVLLPTLMALFLSFTSYDVLTPIQWTGLDNYTRLLRDNLFFVSLRNIFTYALLYIPLMIVLSLLLAVALNRKRPGMKLFRTMFYIPVISSPVAAATVWIWLLHRDNGLINQMLAVFGINGPAWLSNADTVMLAVVLVTLWQGIGSNMIVYLAGLQGIPEHLYEAAKLDGANAMQRFRFITWPSLRTTTFFVSTLSLIGAFQLFDQAYILGTGPGPGNAVRTPVYHIYTTGFERLRMGYASSQAFVLFIIILVISLINIRINQQGESAENA